jgi:hypothetical protein
MTPSLPPPQKNGSFITFFLQNPINYSINFAEKNGKVLKKGKVAMLRCQINRLNKTDPKEPYRDLQAQYIEGCNQLGD